MTTTFKTRELVRDELVALFVANGSWQDVYGYKAANTEISGRSPVLTLVATGTRQRFENLDTNPASYRFEIINYVMSSSDSDASVTTSVAEDELDNLDKVIRQIIRNNAGSLTNASNLYFDDNYSNVERGAIGNTPYIRETYVIFADLPGGA